MKVKSTKKALIASLLMLAICFTSFVGTTFAWFTDSVSSSGNKIVAGSLKIDLELHDKENDKWNSIKESHAPIFNYEYWEPGYVDAKLLKVENEGNLALKWKAKFVSNAELGILADVIDVYVLPYGVLTEDEAAAQVAYPATRDLFEENYTRVGTLREFVNTIESTTYGNLQVGETAYLGIALKMQEGAGNEYQTQALGAFDIQIVATQLAYENDSFGPDYDAGAEYDGEITNSDGLKAALAAGGSYQLKNDIVLEGTAEIPAGKEVILDLAGNNIIASATAIKNNGTLTINNNVATASTLALRAALVGGGIDVSSATDAVAVENRGDLTINGGTYIGTVNAYKYAIHNYSELVINDATVIGGFGGVWTFAESDTVINGGYYTNSDDQGAHVVFVKGGKLTVNGGTFEGFVQDNNNYQYTIFANNNASVDINDGKFIAPTSSTGARRMFGASAGASIAVSGGSFDVDVNAFVADGSYLVGDASNGYFVLPELEDGSTLTMVAGYPELYTDGTNYYVYTAEGLISMRNYWAANQYSNHMWGCSYNIMDNINATGYTWNEVYVVVGNNANDGFILDGHGNTITGLTINGSMFTGTPNGGNAGTAPGEVKDITFDGVTVNGGHWTAVVWGNTYGEIVFENVNVINSTISGKCNTAAFVGGTCQESGDVTVTFKNCAVKNTTISANGAFSGVEGDWASDPNGANVYISRAFNKAYIVFEGENVSENNTVTNVNGVTGGGIYGYVAFVDGWWASIGTSESFTNWNGISVVSNSDQLTEAFKSSGLIIMTGDIKTEAATTAPYGNKYAFKMDGGTLDGNGNELYMECYGDDYGIMTSGGTIKNLTIKEGCRAIMIMYANEDIIIDNVKVGGDGVLYPINTGEAGEKEVKLVVTNSTLAGWTSYGVNIASASFTNVKFEQGTYYNNIYGRVLKPYVSTTLENCSFVAHMNLDLSALGQGQKVTISNCTVNGQTITIDTFTIPTTDAQYDTELFTVDLPAWATSISDCVEFK